VDTPTSPTPPNSVDTPACPTLTPVDTPVNPTLTPVDTPVSPTPLTPVDTPVSPTPLTPVDTPVSPVAFHSENILSPTKITARSGATSGGANGPDSSSGPRSPSPTASIPAVALVSIRHYSVEKEITLVYGTV
jgi:hypothetical protein